MYSSMPVELSDSNDRRRAEPDLNRGGFGFDQNCEPIMGENEKESKAATSIIIKTQSPRNRQNYPPGFYRSWSHRQLIRPGLLRDVLPLRLP